MNPEILKRLRNNDPTLTSLSLWNNNIGPKGACALAEALKQNKFLTTLGLENNEIGNEGAKCLAHY